MASSAEMVSPSGIILGGMLLLGKDPAVGLVWIEIGMVKSSRVGGSEKVSVDCDWGLQFKSLQMDMQITVVFDLDKNYKITLDSMEAPGHKYKAERVVSTVDEYLNSLGFAEFKYKEQFVKQESNTDDCGFYILWFMRRIAEGGDIDNIDEGTITQYRKQLALFIFNYNEDINITDLTETGNGSSEESDGRANDDGIGLEVNSSNEEFDGSTNDGNSSNVESDGRVSSKEVRNSQRKRHPETIGSADVSGAKKFRGIESILGKGRKGRNSALNHWKQVYVDTINLADDELLLRIKASKIPSPFKLYKRSEPDPDKAIKFMKHIFDNHGNDSKILIDDN
ncbi:hypothetical protein ABZP36_002693 [Zizania latifolia]